MMIDPLTCPECGSVETERVLREENGDVKSDTYICNDCPTQYTVKFEAFDKEESW